MISKAALRECYVYVTLPGHTAAVTAGRFELTTDLRDVPLGRFIYARSYLERREAIPLDPVELKLGRQAYETRAMHGLFGALRDASPDHWGRRVIERHAGLTRLDELDYLLYAADDRAGALGFGLGTTPPAPRRDFNRTLELERLQAIADVIDLDGEPPAGASGEQVSELMLLGTSMGGARPKAVVEDEEGLWIAKFNRHDDPWNNARVEHAMLSLARECGIETAYSKLTQAAGRDVLLVKRFDREKTADGYFRARMVSALTVLRAEDSHRSRELWSYPLLAEEIRRVCTEPRKNGIELFRRMCFNALISNTDDHPRNHALLAPDENWKLSPAYDLTPTTPVSLERRDLAMACGAYGRYANAANLVSESRRFLLEPDEARALIAQMEVTVKNRWHSVARAGGVSERDCERIEGAFGYPGFRYQVAERGG